MFAPFFLVLSVIFPYFTGIQMSRQVIAPSTDLKHRDSVANMKVVKVYITNARGSSSHAWLIVGIEAGLALLAVGDDVHSALELFANNLGHRATNARYVSFIVVWLAAQSRVHDFEQILRTGQAANVGR
jgi:hypothetical protein